MTAPALHIAWAQLFVRSAFLAGVRDIVVSPGSRSTPLALAAHESPDVRSHFIVDERTAAFFALGQARVTGRPTMLVCTSGTAGAHYYPAVIEAAMSFVPMLVVTADRPWELQHIGASQTIDQGRLFGGFARMFASLGAPEPLEGPLRGVARVAAQAVAASLGPEPGPVHVNAPFRKPLEPAPMRGGAATSASVDMHSPYPSPEPWERVWEALMQSGAARAVSPAESAPSGPALDEIARLLLRAERGVIVCGPAPAERGLAERGLAERGLAERGLAERFEAYRRDLAALALALGFPVLAEATSHARFGLAAPSGGPQRGPVVISSFDALMRSAAFRERLAPDAILELGAPATSAGYAQLLAEKPGIARVVVTPHGWSDPAATASVLVRSSVPAFCRALLAAVVEPRELGDPPRELRDPSRELRDPSRELRDPSRELRDPSRELRDPSRELGRASGESGNASRDETRMRARAAYASALAGADAAARAAADALVGTATEGEPTEGEPGAPLTEAAVARAVVDACPPGSILVLGNSSPVRDADAWCPASEKPLCVLHQRGASGIDGLVSGAAGAQSVSRLPLTLVLGDLSLLHDIGGLLSSTVGSEAWNSRDLKSRPH